MSRPKKVIDLLTVEKLAAIGCTNDEIGGVLGITRKTITRHMALPDFRLAMEKGRANMRASIRRQQIEVARKGNSTMLIWLGKQYLGQSDSMALTGANHGPIAVDGGPRERLVSLLDRIASRIQSPAPGPS